MNPLGTEEDLSASTKQSKMHWILAACGDFPDLEALVQLATSGSGLVDDQIRRKACISALGRFVPLLYTDTMRRAPSARLRIS